MASSSSSNRHDGKIIKRANPATIQDKFLVGYQGWFTCGGDGEPVGPGHHGWLHWMNAPIPDGGHPNVDLWPDVSSYSPSELFPVPGLKTKTGDPVSLFSSRNPKTVQRHFHWMAEHGVDGAFLQRFLGQCDIEAGNEGILRIRDEVGDRVKEAAEREGRVFAIMYDVVGVPPDRILKTFQRDWMHLIRNKGILDSPNYLKERGKPVVALWGLGFDNAKHTPELVRSVVQFFRNTTPGGVYIMAGTPSSWRTAEGDADPNPEFLNVWLDEFDAISPWTVGRYSNDQEADNFMETKMKGDVELINHRNEQGTGKKIDYIPVVLPGGSGFNTSEGHWGFNNIKRNGGRFLWKQIANAKHLGVRTIYGAMWDEYDEGTAFMPAVEHKSALPDNDKFKFMALDEDGYDVPADWYMRVCGFAAEGLRGERRIFDTFPVKELQDYWSSRPKYEEVSQKSGEFVSGKAGASGDGDGQTYEEWLASQKESRDELPPPPYTLISDESEPGPSTSGRAEATPSQAPAPAPIPVGVSHTGPVHASSPVPATASSAPAPVPGAASLTSTGPQASQTGSSSFSDGPGHSQVQRVSGHSYETPNNNAVGGYPPHSYQPGAVPAGSTPASHPPPQSYYTGGATQPGSKDNEVQQPSHLTGYGPSPYHPNTPTSLSVTNQSQPPYHSSGPAAGTQPCNNQTGYGPTGHQSGPPPNVPGGPAPSPQQSFHGVPNQGPQNSSAPGATGGAASSYHGGGPPGGGPPGGATHPQKPYQSPDFAHQNASGAPAPVTGPQQGNNQANYPPHSHQSGPPSNLPGGSAQQPYQGIANQGPANNNPAGASGGSASSYQGAPPGPPGAPRPQQPYSSSDPISSLTSDFGRQNISGAPPVGATGGTTGRPGASPPPGHPHHPSASRPGGYGPPPSAYPTNHSRPQSQQGPRPQAAYAPNPGAPAHNVGSNLPAQWPPQGWDNNSQHTRPNTTGSPPPAIPHSTHPQGPPVNPGGANAPRPGYGGAVGPSVRPSSGSIHRPSSRPPSRPPQGPPPPGNYSSSYRPVSPSSGFPSVQSYSAASQPYGVSESPFPQPHPSSTPYGTSSASPVSFPGGPSAPYPPSMSSYQAPGGSSFPGSTEGSHYGPSRPNFAWPGGPSGSPPHSPGPGANFPGADVYNPSRPYSPVASNSSFPSSSPYPPGGGLGAPNVGGIGFSPMPGAQTYPGGGMPTADQSAYQPPYGPGDQYNASTYPAPGGSSFPSASPWASGSGSGSMMPPPRPANHSSTSFGSSSQQVKPSSTGNFPMASNALGMALNAVDKVAGKKTRDQLENQVENLAQTGAKLFNKLTR